MRYYHGLIDTQLLDSGIEYDKLPNVVIIIILPYDPFGKNRMVYTIQNQCVEDAAVPYNDGAKKIFLYTKGTEGIISFIKSCHALNILKADVLTQLRRNFDLTEVDGKAYIESYWDDIQ